MVNHRLSSKGLLEKLLPKIYSFESGGVVHWLGRRASNRKVAKSSFYSRCGSAFAVCSLPVVVTQPDERYANRTASVLEWYERHRAYII